jgi:hypothetical protein
MVPSMIIVLAWSILIVEDVNEAVVLLWELLQLLETLNLIISVIETGSNDQCLVRILSTVGKHNLVLFWLVLDDSGTNVGSRPWFNLGGDGGGLELLSINMTV